MNKYFYYNDFIMYDNSNRFMGELIKGLWGFGVLGFWGDWKRVV